jgi:uncharacterized OB-fold protein
MAAAWPSRIDHDTRVYWAGLADRLLRLARCRDCAHWIHPPRACCPQCWSDDIGDDQPSGEATLFSYMIQPIAPGGEPVVVGWAELIEQRRLLVVAPIEAVTAQTVRIGAPLRLDWKAGETPLPFFRVTSSEP